MLVLLLLLDYVGESQGGFLRGVLYYPDSSASIEDSDIEQQYPVLASMIVAENCSRLRCRIYS